MPCTHTQCKSSLKFNMRHKTHTHTLNRPPKSSRYETTCSQFTLGQKPFNDCYCFAIICHLISISIILYIHHLITVHHHIPKKTKRNSKHLIRSRIGVHGTAVSETSLALISFYFSRRSRKHTKKKKIDRERDTDTELGKKFLKSAQRIS